MAKETTLFEKLSTYSRSDIYPFCMPGHKRMTGIGEADFYKLDITEVEGFDDLHRAKGILKNITDHAATVYSRLASQAEKEPAVFMSVNGSTACNLAALNCIGREGSLLIAANCHRSVFNGAALSKRKVIELAPDWISPMAVYGGISPDAVENALRGYPDICAVVITSPSYEGFVSDVRTIADIVHSHGAYLIVDEAHGAHFPFCRELPVSALYLGADIVIHSLHKTMGSLNQTALGFVTDAELVEPFHQALLTFTTTSPSYILMASIEQAVLWAEAHPEAFDDYCKRLDALRGKLPVVDNSIIGRYNIFDLDRAKLMFFTKQMSGEELYRRFYEKHHLQFEKFGDRYALAMTSVWDTKEGFDRLLQAVEEECLPWEKFLY